MSLKITFKAKNVKVENQDDDMMTVEVQNNLDFLSECVLKDETLEEFLADVGTKKYLLRKIGVEDLKRTFSKEELKKLCEGLDLEK